MTGNLSNHTMVQNSRVRKGYSVRLSRTENKQSVLLDPAAEAAARGPEAKGRDFFNLQGT